VEGLINGLLSKVINQYYTKLTYVNKFQITKTSFISHTSKMRISFLTIFPHHFAVIVHVLSKESLRVVIAVNIDLGEGIVSGWFIATFMDTSFQPWQEQLQPE
jgi:hypothetical protein